jgi:subtilase family serine protease
MGLLSRVRAMRAVLPAMVLLSVMGHAVAQRLVGAIDGGARVTLAGSVIPLTGHAIDLGPAPDGQRLPLLSIHFAMTAAQQTALGRLLADQQNPISPRYRLWLTPEQFGAQFGLSSADAAQVAEWLTAQGFSVSAVARGGQFILFSGTVAQANAAFGTAIHQLSLGGLIHIANVKPVSLPVALAAVTAGVAGLDDFKPVAHAASSTVQGSGGGSVHALYTAAGTHYLAPADFSTIYDEKPLLTSNVTGTGVSVAVVGQTDVNAADIIAFQKAAGLANNPATVTLYGSDPGFTNAADLLVAEQGLEWVNAAAPGATLIYANSINALYGSLTLAVDNNLAPIIADGYGQCEAVLQANNLVYYSQILEQAAAQGMTITAPSGQYGATDCDTGVATAVQGLAVDFPASSPLVTGVGGTEFNDATGTYWSATNATNGGSALSYIPEMVWNDDSSTALAASGGGASLYFAKPAWQGGTGVPADFARDVPDVSLSASAVHDAYLVCVAGSCTNGFANAAGTLTVAGGTSVSAAAFAGLLAVVEQKVGARLGVANPVLYALANSSYGVFHDTTTGTNASPCTAASPNCPNGGTIGFAATSGYDETTGLGSVDAYKLANDWLLVAPTALTGGAAFTYTNIAGNASTISAGTPVALATSVASAETAVTTVPTGSVQITVDSVAIGGMVALTGGAASSSLNTTGLAVGTHVIQATYLGDSTFQGSRGAFQLTVAAATNPDFALTPGTASITTASGTVAPGVVLTVSALNGFTGNVTFKVGTPSSTAIGYSFSNNPVVLSTATPSGSTTLSLFAYLLAKDSMPAKPATPGWMRGSGIVLAGLMLVILPRRRKLSGALLAVLAFVAIGLSGCMKTTAPATSNLPPTTPTPVGTYTLTVEATGPVNGTTVSHVSTITLVVQ